MSKVAVVKGERSIKVVRQGLELLGDLSFLSSKPVFIKVNFISKRDWKTGATTDPIVVEGIVQHLLDFGCNISVVESNATMTNAEKTAQYTGMTDVCNKFDIPFINLSKVKEKVKVNIEDHQAVKKLTFPKMILNGFIISAAKMKTHSETGVTLGLKNMFGLIPDKFKGKYHLFGIDKVIVDIASVIRPTLTVIDGFVAMEGRGPIIGSPIPMNLIVTGLDPVAVDSTTARIMGFNPKEIYHIRICAERNYGSINDIQSIGVPIESVTRKFKRT